MASAQRQRIPLFPLNVVLFPGADLPVRIFEERYKALLADALKGGKEFGVCLIAKGKEVGEAAEPHPVGTVAAIEDVQEQSDMFFLDTAGTRRFRVVETHADKPYPEATVEFLPEPEAASELPRDVGTTLRQSYDRYLQNLTFLGAATNQRWNLRSLPRNFARTALETSYLVADGLFVEAKEKQPLLELDDPHERVRREIELLERENVKLEIVLRRYSVSYN